MKTRKLIPAKLFLISAAVIAGTSSVLAFNQYEDSTADVMSPTEVRVNEHEERITKNAADLSVTKQRVDQVEQQTAENGQAIASTTERVTVVERQVAIQQETSQAQQSAPAPTLTTEPAPQPVKTVNPRLVSAVVVTERSDRFGNKTGWQCTYTMESGKEFAAYQGLDHECHLAGQEVSNDLAVMFGIR